MENMTKQLEIKSINIWSVFKISLIAYLLIGLLAGLFIGVFGAMIGGFFSAADLEEIPFASGILGATGGFLGGLLLGVVFGIIYGLGGGIFAVLGALVYNLFASIAGGIKIRVKEGA